MKVTQLSVVSFSLLALSACSSNSTTPASNDAIDANNYRTTLKASLSQLRGEHFRPFISATDMANKLFDNPLPEAREYFGPTPLPLGSAIKQCESGSVTRDTLSSDAQRLIIEASFKFADCHMQGNVFIGEVLVTLDGDHPSRRGGQVSKVTMQFNDIQLKSGASLDTSSTLTGSFSNRSSWAAASIRYEHVYTTQRYSQLSNDIDISIDDAYYTQKLESDYYPDDATYYRLSEFGSLTLSGTINEKQAGYIIEINPSLEYSSKLNANNRPVYDDDLASGKIIYTAESTASITVTPNPSDASLVSYEINDGVQSFSEDDEWAFPIDCNDNSAMNNRSLCDVRR